MSKAENTSSTTPQNEKAAAALWATPEIALALAIAIPALTGH